MDNVFKISSQIPISKQTDSNLVVEKAKLYIFPFAGEKSVEFN